MTEGIEPLMAVFFIICSFQQWFTVRFSPQSYANNVTHGNVCG